LVGQKPLKKKRLFYPFHTSIILHNGVHMSMVNMYTSVYLTCLPVNST